MLTHRALRLAACLLPLLAFGAGCADADSVTSEDTDGEDSAIGVAQGVDYSWGRPDPNGLRAAGYTFAARYVSEGDSGKNISHGEADALIAAGVDVVLVWEQETDAVLGGYARGVHDAQIAAQKAADAGQPADRPLYFAVDFDAQPSQQGTVDAYFDGAASVIGRSRVGAYGGYYLIKRLFDGGKITWGWQAYAWSYGNWDPRAQVRQVNNGESVAGGEVDLDVAITADIGQWGHGQHGGGGAANETAVEVAFQANTSSLWTTGSAGTKDWGLGMATSTSPAIASGGAGYQFAFQANTGNLWSVASDGSGGDLQLGMRAGTSPSITALRGGGYQIAFQANTGSLWTTGAAGTQDLGLGMMDGTSPSITALADGGYEIAFQANTSSLWTTGTAGTTDWALGMAGGTSPAIAGLDDGSFQVAFQANTTSLWVVSSAGGGGDQGLGLLPGTSPAITAINGGWEVAFQANTTSLWTHGTSGTTDWKLGMMPGSSPGIGRTPSGGFQASFEANTTSLWTVTDGVGADLGLGMMKGTSPSGT